MDLDYPNIKLILKEEKSIVAKSDVFEYDSDNLTNGFTSEDISFFNSIKNESYRSQRFSVRWLLKQSLLEYWNLEEYKLTKDENGKPFLLNNYLHISLSHNIRSTAIMVDSDPCGVDIELLRPRISKIAHKFLNEAEQDFTDNDITKQTLIWSAKEAAYKALGKAGILFKENLLCDIQGVEQAGRFKLLIRLDEMPQREMDIQYEFHDDEVITFGRLH